MTVYFFTSFETLRVLGGTEAFYVQRYFEKRARLRGFLEDAKGDKTVGGDNRVVYRRIGSLPSLLHVNLPAAWALLRFGLAEDTLVYTYNRLVAPGLIARLTGHPWVVDFQAPPIEEDIDFAYAQGDPKPVSPARRRFRKRLLRFLLRFSSLAVTLNDDIKRILIEDYGIPEKKIHLLPMGVDLERFRPAECPLLPSPFRIAHTGSWDLRLLGIAETLEALGGLKADGLAAQLVFAGSPFIDSEEDLRNLIRRLDVSDRVELHGFIPHDRIPALLATCHIGLSPRRDVLSQRVSSPAKVTEYLAMGKPVIASDISAHRRVIRDGWNGLLFRSGDAAGLARTIKRLIENPSLYLELARHARESVEHLSWNSLLGTLCERLEAISKR